ncbi:hypothetical protein [Novosphingobium mangrovi (ex Huang et al. 2023)]|uniref:Uncharacterized protein n=1 Tax=Novosphingobium mangrovi (ex Huang et al. 2023) TaxID=2976432 RepID=A0ABT2I135_9SPHN|nr:hypothetical protein [Novosphingobium mangrovi (ex Huang et al. 2023)]MCT2398505.1 hypothetical protein [Novosphingobium mangrovi (ex Huang et al. 2023)]
MIGPDMRSSACQALAGALIASLMVGSMAILMMLAAAGVFG